MRVSILTQGFLSFLASMAFSMRMCALKLWNRMLLGNENLPYYKDFSGFLITTSASFIFLGICGHVCGFTHTLNAFPNLNYHTPLTVLAKNISLSSTLHLSPWVFTCVTYVHLHKNQWSKLYPCVICCIFFEFAPQQKKKKNIDVIIWFLIICMSLWMLLSLNQSFCSPLITPICFSRETREKTLVGVSLEMRE